MAVKHKAKISGNNRCKLAADAENLLLVSIDARLWASGVTTAVSLITSEFVVLQLKLITVHNRDFPLSDGIRHRRGGHKFVVLRLKRKCI